MKTILLLVSIVALSSCTVTTNGSGGYTFTPDAAAIGAVSEGLIHASK